MMVIKSMPTEGKHSVDQISLDLFSWSKVSVKFGVWSNALFVCWSKFLIINFYILSFDQIISHVFSWSKVLLMSFWVILNFWSTAKNPSVLFWQLIKSSNNGILGFLSTFNQVPKKNLLILALDRMYCWLRNRAEN